MSDHRPDDPENVRHIRYIQTPPWAIAVVLVGWLFGGGIFYGGSLETARAVREFAVKLDMISNKQAQSDTINASINAEQNAQLRWQDQAIKDLADEVRELRNRR